ncbi:hypothetical protein os1_06580 [Comamonadaceae bacterium OS-1]|nr:hypothetical protein os1_06580 [Comamonadaceae bacterium OS-1]
MPTTLTYLFDPLCGWCYGASPVLQQLGQHPEFTLALAPTGLFAGGGRTMDAAFAEFAWSNDTRIAKLTGQPFTPAYRTQVLGRHGSLFDSSTATLALTAVSLTAPARELQALKLLQEARYVDGLDTTAVPVVARLLRDADLATAADRLVAADTELHQANTQRLQRAQGLMRSLGASGVPALVRTDASGSRLLPGNALFGSFEQLLDALQA